MKNHAKEHLPVTVTLEEVSLPPDLSLLFSRLATFLSSAEMDIYVASKRFRIGTEAEDINAQANLGLARTELHHAREELERIKEQLTKKEQAATRPLIDLQEVIGTIIRHERQRHTTSPDSHTPRPATAQKTINFEIKPAQIHGDVLELTTALSRLFFLLYELEEGKDLGVYLTTDDLKKEITIHFDHEGNGFTERITTQWEIAQKWLAHLDPTLPTRETETAELFFKALQGITRNQGQIDMYSRPDRCGFNITFPLPT